MDDPSPENIIGEKRVTHAVEHQIPWGQIAIGIGLLAVAYVGHRAFLSGSGGTDDSEEIEPASLGDATDIPVSGGGLTA